MVNKILTVIAFLGFTLEQVLNSSIPFRLLGVKCKHNIFNIQIQGEILREMYRLQHIKP
ncbi:hypothetical protein [Clostridium manihotivorum]|uniref:hypothetical protein n=1 Tax=Clostridium manihotivorum TaxID=2320868 RepID=UPI0013E3622F|nr:hypothetical protein [Clostridium manihotivorum]